MLFHTKITGIKRGEQYRNAHGQLVYGPDTEIPMRGEVVSGAARETPNGTIGTLINTHLLLLPPSNTLQGNDRVRIFGNEYELQGHPAPIVIGGRVHHHEVEIVRKTS